MKNLKRNHRRRSKTRMRTTRSKKTTTATKKKRKKRLTRASATTRTWSRTNRALETPTKTTITTTTTTKTTMIPSHLQTTMTSWSNLQSARLTTNLIRTVFLNRSTFFLFFFIKYQISNIEYIYLYFFYY